MQATRSDSAAGVQCRPFVVVVGGGASNSVHAALTALIACGAQVIIEIQRLRCPHGGGGGQIPAPTRIIHHGVADWRAGGRRRR